MKLRDPRLTIHTALRVNHDLERHEEHQENRQILVHRKFFIPILPGELILSFKPSAILTVPQLSGIHSSLCRGIRVRIRAGYLQVAVMAPHAYGEAEDYLGL